MTQWSRISTFANDGTGRVFSTYRYVQRQPSWITRAALYVFLIVVGLPIALFLLLAFALAVVVFGTLALGYALVQRVRRMIPGSDGRSNVRVIVRDDRTS